MSCLFSFFQWSQLVLSWPLWTLQPSYFAVCFSIWVYLLFHHKIEVTHFWQKHHRSDSTLLIHPVKWRKISFCHKTGNVKFDHVSKVVSAKIYLLYIILSPFIINILWRAALRPYIYISWSSSSFYPVVSAFNYCYDR